MEAVHAVGDELAFRRTGIGLSPWTIHTVTHITKSGRISCGPYTLNPDLSVRKPVFIGPYQAENPTDEIRQLIERGKLLRKIRNCHFTCFTLEQLRDLCDLIDKTSPEQTQ